MLSYHDRFQEILLSFSSSSSLSCRILPQQINYIDDLDVLPWPGLGQKVGANPGVPWQPSHVSISPRFCTTYFHSYDFCTGHDDGVLDQSKSFPIKFDYEGPHIPS